MLAKYEAIADKCLINAVKLQMQSQNFGNRLPLVYSINKRNQNMTNDLSVNPAEFRYVEQSFSQESHTSFLVSTCRSWCIRASDL